MRDPETKVQSYSAAMKIGQPVISITLISKVLKSDNSKFIEGSLVFLFLSGVESYSTVAESKLGMARVLEPEDGIPLTAHLGALGMTGIYL
jgi:NADPH-dependent curcumin reductase CurA